VAQVFSLEQQEVRRLAEDLLALSKKALPHAVRNSLNATAFAARNEWSKSITKSMVLRNKWTVNSLRVEKAQGVSIGGMVSKVGTPLDYMKTQEEGGTKHPKTGKHVPIPTRAAAGMSMKAGKGKSAARTKGVQAKNYQTAIRLAGKRVGYGVRQFRNQVAISAAVKAGGGVVYLDLGRRKGLFSITGTKKGGLRIRMLWDLSRKAVHDKPRPTMKPTLAIIERIAPSIQKQAILEQMDRYHLHLGYHGPVRKIHY
jgi:hypothetical protein